MRLLALKAVRLVNDENRANDGQRFHETLGVAKQIGFHPALVNHLAVTGKRLVGSHHHRNARVGRMNKPLHRAGRVIKDVDFLTVLLAKKLGRGLQAAQSALANGVGGHQHNELGQFFVFVQAVNGLDEGECFARAGFHQHVQAQGGRGCHGHLHITCANTVAAPNLGEVGAQGRRGFMRHQGGVAVRVNGWHKPHIVEHIRE